MVTDSNDEKRAAAPDPPGGSDSNASRDDKKKRYALPMIDFATFILSINSTALVQLGLIEDPASGEKVKNLPLAKQSIDLIAMLEEKTRGNLTNDEENILKGILYELRLLYVKEKG
jgi:hypothetical protein